MRACVCGDRGVLVVGVRVRLKVGIKAWGLPIRTATSDDQPDFGFSMTPPPCLRLRNRGACVRVWCREAFLFVRVPLRPVRQHVRIIPVTQGPS